ncbi:MAG: hypothetical protein KC618_05420, partial [Candidatus Omnitrophica bacterium]|nr:hypothetical protein [Candidatus Omnitrophota bacterium]
TFNILAFRDEITRFKPNSVSPNQNTITQAVRFVENLTAGAKTDTYNALNESIKTKIVQTPSYIILLSDGRSTEGVTDSTKIINEISTYNNGRRSIFAFSGGLRVNRYLLDFISYKNRGWTEYAYRTHLIDEHLTSMYEKIKDPIFLNLRYRSNGLNTGEMFPKILPDFFRNAEFTLYGIYDEQDQFVLQLLADFKGKTKEFIMQGKLQSAPQGSEDIAKNWAFNKIYYLISSLEHDKKNDAIIKQIRELSEKFNIDTPYSGDIADIDLH